MHGVAVLALAAAVSALPTTLEKRQDLTGSNLFICSSNAVQGGCALNGNPYYVNQATTGNTVAGLLGIWECPTSDNSANITAVCCSSFSHDGDYDYSHWCDTPRTSMLSTAALTGLLDGTSSTGATPESVSSGNSDLTELMDELTAALTELDMDRAEAELEAATQNLDPSVLEDVIEQLTDTFSAEVLEADLKQATDSL